VQPQCLFAFCEASRDEHFIELLMISHEPRAVARCAIHEHEANPQLRQESAMKLIESRASNKSHQPPMKAHVELDDAIPVARLNGLIEIGRQIERAKVVGVSDATLSIAGSSIHRLNL